MGYGFKEGGVEHWWRLRDNPLYAWEAISLSLSSKPPEPIPEWCLPYLRDAAAQIANLSWRVGRGELDSETANDLVPKALQFVTGVKGQKNAFARVADDRQLMKASLSEGYGLGGAQELAKQRNIEEETARRNIRRRGDPLTGVKGKS